MNDQRAKGRTRPVLPAIGLFLLAPIVAEFLLGNMPITMLGLLTILAPVYGGGALLIREAARRLRLGWASILVMALAYGIVEEAFLDQTLFNPDFLGLHLDLLEPHLFPRWESESGGRSSCSRCIPCGASQCRCR